MKWKHIWKIILGVVVIFFVFCFLFGEDESEVIETTYSGEDTWAVYWYLCGSDLETEYGAATDDLYELQETVLPDNVQVVIETGGAADWYHEDVEAGQIGRYVYDSDGLSMVEERPDANMGDPETLADFLTFCETNYPADHAAVVLWNHGGGTVYGVAFDEGYDMDSLTMDELHQAFDSTYDLSAEEPPLEMVGFDACLMATIDTASMLSDVSHYLVASQETEPGCGWYYSEWVQTLGDNPGMDGAQLGKVICDTYMEGCEYEAAEDEATLSVVDLQKIDNLLTAYDDLGKEALTLAYEEPTFFAEFGRDAISSENYGGNTPDLGYTNMVDLGHLVRNSSDLLTETSQSVLDALEECVVYQVKGAYRDEATGLSCYYSYDGDMDDFYGYAMYSASEVFPYLYDYELNGSLSEDGLQYLSGLGVEETDEVQEIQSGADFGLEDHPLYVDEDANYVLELGAERASTLKSVYYQLCYVSLEDDIILALGRDNDIYSDWDEGIFRDNFRGVWGSIDDYLCYMEIVFEGDDYNLYSVPILLNGEEYSLQVVYSYTDEEYQILGAKKGIDENGMADKNMVQLEPGDEITTLHYGMTISGDDEDFTQVEVDTFTVTSDTSFYETDLGDGLFYIMFEMVDTYNESYFSDVAAFTVEGDYIYAETE